MPRRMRSRLQLYHMGVYRSNPNHQHQLQMPKQRLQPRKSPMPKRCHRKQSQKQSRKVHHEVQTQFALLLRCGNVLLVEVVYCWACPWHFGEATCQGLDVTISGSGKGCNVDNLKRVKWAASKFEASTTREDVAAAIVARAGHLNDAVVAYEAPSYGGKGVRWFKERPLFWPGPRGWGCGACNALFCHLTSQLGCLKQGGGKEVEAKNTYILKQLADIRKNGNMVQLQSQSMPQLSNLKEHCSSTFHERGMRFVLGSGGSDASSDVVTLHDARRLQVESGIVDVAQKSATCHEWLRLLDAVRGNVSARVHAKQAVLERECHDPQYAGQSVSSTFYTTGVHSFAEYYRRQWREALARAETAQLSYDGQKKYEDLFFTCTELKTLTTTQGLLGIANTHDAQTFAELDVPKSQRMTAAVRAELAHFCTQTNSSKTYHYNNGHDPHLQKHLEDIFEFITSDRCNEIMEASRLMGLLLFRKLRHLGADFAHEVRVFLRNACTKEPLMRKITHDLFKKKHAYGRRLRYSAKAKGRVSAATAEVKKIVEETGVNADLVIELLEDLNSAPHRWDSESEAFERIVTGFLGIVYNQSRDSVSNLMKKEEKQAAVESMRLWCLESGLMCGLYAQLQKYGQLFLATIQDDNPNTSCFPRMAEEWIGELETAFTSAELFRDSEQYKGTMVRLMLEQLRVPIAFHFGEREEEVLAFGWAVRDNVPPQWAMSALNRFQVIISLVKKLLQETFSDDTFDGFLKCFDLERWMRRSSHPQLTELFKQFVKYLELPQCEDELLLVMPVALGIYKTECKNNLAWTTMKKNEAQKNCWRQAALQSELRHDVTNFKRSLARFLTYSKNSCCNERDIRYLDELASRGKCTPQFLRDATIVLRFGPKTHAELVHRRIEMVDGKESIIMEPTKLLQDVMAIHYELRGGRHRCNKKTRKDKGATHAKVDRGRSGIKRKHDEALAAIKTRTYESGMKSIFGPPLKHFRTSHEDACKRWNDDFKSAFRKYRDWKGKHRKRVAVSAKDRFQTSAVVKTQLRTKQVVMQQHKRDMKLQLNMSLQSEMEEALVKLTDGCGVSVTELKAPWRPSLSLAQAQVVCVPSLDGASNLKHDLDAPLTSPVVCALLLGQRLCTSKYLVAVSSLASKKCNLVEASSLSISLKFQRITMPL